MSILSQDLKALSPFHRAIIAAKLKDEGILAALIRAAFVYSPSTSMPYVPEEILHRSLVIHDTDGSSCKKSTTVLNRTADGNADLAKISVCVLAQSAQFMPSLVRHYYREASKKVFAFDVRSVNSLTGIQESMDLYALLSKHFSAQLVQKEISTVQVKPIRDVIGLTRPAEFNPHIRQPRDPRTTDYKRGVAGDLTSIMAQCKCKCSGCGLVHGGFDDLGADCVPASRLSLVFCRGREQQRHRLLGHSAEEMAAAVDSVYQRSGIAQRYYYGRALHLIFHHRTGQLWTGS